MCEAQRPPPSSLCCSPRVHRGDKWFKQKEQRTPWIRTKAPGAMLKFLRTTRSINLQSMNRKGGRPPLNKLLSHFADIYLLIMVINGTVVRVHVAFHLPLHDANVLKPPGNEMFSLWRMICTEPDLCVTDDAGPPERRQRRWYTAEGHILSTLLHLGFLLGVSADVPQLQQLAVLFFFSPSTHQFIIEYSEVVGVLRSIAIWNTASSSSSFFFSPSADLGGAFAPS